MNFLLQILLSFLSAFFLNVGETMPTVCIFTNPSQRTEIFVSQKKGIPDQSNTIKYENFAINETNKLSFTIWDNILNEYCEWLEDTTYLEEHYTEFVKVPLTDFVFICNKWIEFLKSKT